MIPADLRAALIPAAVFQSFMVAGGYGTGREIAEYFTRFGAGGGLLGITVATLGLALILGLSLELARRSGAHDYASFIRLLIGRFEWAFEILLIVSFLLLLGVMGAAAGSVGLSAGLPFWAGATAVPLIVFTLSQLPRARVVAVLAYGALLLWGVFLTYFLVIALSDGATIAARLREGAAAPGWAVSGVNYALFNGALVPAMLYAGAGLASARQSALAGVLGAFLCMTPAALIHMTLAPALPALLDQPLPIYARILGVGAPWLVGLYLLMLASELINSGLGCTQAIVERLDRLCQDRRDRCLTRRERVVAIVALLAVAGALSALGVIAIVAKGYSAIGWSMVAVYVAPLLTVGVWRLARAPRAAAPAP